MRVVTLLEDETENKKLNAIHGLSLYIEANGKKILFDLGPNKYYLKNAKKLGINIADIDLLVISHGHNDHGNGISKFLKVNEKATVYLSKYVFETHAKKTHGDYTAIGIKKPSFRLHN